MEQLLNNLQIEYQNLNLYINAFTHPSYAHEHTDYSIDNQRLEFLGDAIIDLVISEYLYQNMDLNEGDMSKVRAKYVCEKALVLYAKKLGFDEYILVGNGVQTPIKPAIIADAFEAFVAAIYLDLGYKATCDFVNKWIIPIINSEEIEVEDYKSRLQELVQVDKRTVKYVITKQTGPSHDPTFYVSVYVDEVVLGKGVGSSKKTAEQDAAKCALDKMVVGG